MRENSGNEAKKLDDSGEDLKNLLKGKPQTSEGYLPDPKMLTAWTYNFFNIPEFTFRDLYNNYLVGIEDYSPENLSQWACRTPNWAVECCCKKKH